MIAPGRGGRWWALGLLPFHLAGAEPDQLTVQRRAITSNNTWPQLESYEYRYTVGGAEVHPVANGHFYPVSTGSVGGGQGDGGPVASYEKLPRANGGGSVGVQLHMFLDIELGQWDEKFWILGPLRTAVTANSLPRGALYVRPATGEGALELPPQDGWVEAEYYIQHRRDTDTSGLRAVQLFIIGLLAILSFLRYAAARWHTQLLALGQHVRWVQDRQREAAAADEGAAAAENGEAGGAGLDAAAAHEEQQGSEAVGCRVGALDMAFWRLSEPPLLVTVLQPGERESSRTVGVVLPEPVRGHFKPCMTDIYIHIDARMAD